MVFKYCSDKGMSVTLNSHPILARAAGAPTEFIQGPFLEPTGIHSSTFQASRPQPQIRTVGGGKGLSLSFSEPGSPGFLRLPLAAKFKHSNPQMPLEFQQLWASCTNRGWQQKTAGRQIHSLASMESWQLKFLLSQIREKLDICGSQFWLYIRIAKGALKKISMPRLHFTPIKSQSLEEGTQTSGFLFGFCDAGMEPKGSHMLNTLGL
jgi:hypothetical protein